LRLLPAKKKIIYPIFADVAGKKSIVTSAKFTATSAKKLDFLPTTSTKWGVNKKKFARR
jgi:hypothetical protein